MSVPVVRRMRFERSALVLLLSNLFTIVIALAQKWDAAEAMWIYWGQSVTIGFFNWRRILELRQFSTEGFLVNGKPVEPTPATQRHCLPPPVRKPFAPAR